MNEILIEGDKNLESTVCIAGEGILLENILLPFTLKTTYQNTEYKLEEIQDRIREDGQGTPLILFKFRSGKSQEIKGIQLYVYKKDESALSYLVTGITMPVAEGLVTNKTPYKSLDNPPIKIAGDSEAIFDYLLNNIKSLVKTPTLRHSLN